MASLILEQARALLHRLFAHETAYLGDTQAPSKRVVILGAGYAGTMLAKLLDKVKGIDVVLVSLHDGFVVNKLSALRAAVRGGNWTERTLVPTNHLLSSGVILTGKAKSVDPDGNIVLLEDGRELEYDYLVVATGSRNVSPGDPPVNYSTKEEVADYFSTVKDAIHGSKNIVIVGTGAVGIELAGEIRELAPESTKITIVGRSKQLLNGAFRGSGLKALEKDLRARDIDVILEDEVISHPLAPEEEKSAAPFVKVSPGEAIQLKSGRALPADLLIYSTGSAVNTEFLPSPWLDPVTKEVIVDLKTLQLPSHRNVFAVGDAAKIPQIKQAYIANEDAKVVARNIKDLVAAREPSAAVKLNKPAMAFVNLGSTGGRGFTPYLTLGPWVVAAIKAKYLLVERVWGTIAPDVPIPAA